jgi:hypothetical protein
MQEKLENKKVLVFQHVHLIWLTRSKVQASQGSNQPWNLTLHCIAQRAQIIFESPVFFSYLLTAFSRDIHDRNRANVKEKRSKKIAWIWSYHLQIHKKFKLLAGKFTWGNKAKHCRVMSTKFGKQKRPKMFCLYSSGKLSRP